MKNELDYEREITEIVNQISNVPLKEDILLYATHDECEVGLDVLCNQLDENGIKISKTVFDRIKYIAESLEMKKEVWEPLEPLVE